MTTHDDKAREQRRAMFRAYCECFNNGSRMTPDAIADRLLDAARAALSPASGQEAFGYVSKTGHGTFFRDSLDGIHPDARHLWTPVFAAPAQQVEAEIRDRALEEAAKACYDPSNRGLTEDLWEDACEACAKAIRSLKSAAGRSDVEKWISVTERRPEKGDTVIGYWKPFRDNPIMPSNFGTVTYAGPNEWHNPEDDEDTFTAPTHWMPMPLPPAAGSNNGEKG